MKSWAVGLVVDPGWGPDMAFRKQQYISVANIFPPVVQKVLVSNPRDHTASAMFSFKSLRT